MQIFASLENAEKIYLVKMQQIGNVFQKTWSSVFMKKSRENIFST